MSAICYGNQLSILVVQQKPWRINQTAEMCINIFLRIFQISTSKVFILSFSTMLSIQTQAHAYTYTLSLLNCSYSVYIYIYIFFDLFIYIYIYLYLYLYVFVFINSYLFLFIYISHNIKHYLLQSLTKAFLQN